jgi:hypothetical protein
MHGWGITANLLPPEVLNARRLKVIRKMIIAALIAVVVLGGAGYAYAFFQQRSAQSQLSAEQANTSRLQAAQSKYASVVALTGTIAQIKGELATVMTGDVDATNLVNAVVSRQPAGGTITQLQLSLAAGSSQGSAASAGSGASALDNSGQAQIGSISLTGTARAMPDVAAFVNALGTVPGIVGVYPTSQQVNGSAVQYTIQLALTDKLLTHRYDNTATAPTGGK